MTSDQPLDLDPSDRSEKKLTSTLRIALCLAIDLLFSLVIALIALIVARENSVPMAGALVWGGGTFIATATLVTSIMNHAGAFDRGQEAP